MVSYKIHFSIWIHLCDIRVGNFLSSFFFCGQLGCYVPGVIVMLDIFSLLVTERCFLIVLKLPIGKKFHYQLQSDRIIKICLSVSFSITGTSMKDFF